MIFVDVAQALLPEALAGPKDKPPATARRVLLMMMFGAEAPVPEET